MVRGIHGTVTTWRRERGSTRGGARTYFGRGDTHGKDTTRNVDYTENGEWRGDTLEVRTQTRGGHTW